jgi:hypothetical protein
LQSCGFHCHGQLLDIRNTLAILFVIYDACAKTINSYKDMNRDFNKSICFFAVFFMVVACDFSATICFNRLKFGLAESIIGTLAGPFAEYVTGYYMHNGLMIYTWWNNVVLCAALIISAALYVCSILRNKLCRCCGVLFLVTWFCWLFLGVGYFAYWM